MTDEEVLQVLARFPIMWPNWRGPSDQDSLALWVGEYQALLGDLDLPPVVACLRGMGTREFAPSPVQLRSAVLDALHPAERPPDVDQAWAMVWGSVTGSYRDDSWREVPAIQQAVRAMGGEPHMHETWLVADEVAHRAHFQRFYDAAVRRSRPDVLPGADRAVLDRLRDVGRLPEGVAGELEADYDDGAWLDEPHGD